jgi:hypothetical protein
VEEPTVKASRVVNSSLEAEISKGGSFALVLLKAHPDGRVAVEFHARILDGNDDDLETVSQAALGLLYTAQNNDLDELMDLAPDEFLQDVADVLNGSDPEGEIDMTDLANMVVKGRA